MSQAGRVFITDPYDFNRESGVACVVDRRLCVDAVITGDTSVSKILLSSSALGEPQTVSATPVTIHDPAASGSAATRDFMTIYVGNPNSVDDLVTFFWQSGNSTVVFAPALETVSALVGIPIDFGEILGALAQNPFAVQSLEVFGHVERRPV